MAHQAQLANVKYRNWVRAALGFKYVKEGLETFCDDLVAQQHSDILSRRKLKHSLSAVSCGYCDVYTIQPNHVRTKNKECPLAQSKCNCQYPGGKVSCPNNVCGAIYDEIIQFHASTPPAPYWKNTNAHQWCTEPWSVAKCFINAPGYEQKTKASEFDCSGLLHVLINNKGFHQHIKCKISGTDVFSRVRKSRNKIFHSNTMELEDNEVNSYIDDMIEVLEDETEIKHRQDSKDAVKKLLELKQEDFIISTIDETEIRSAAMAAIYVKETQLKQTITDADKKLKTKAEEEKHDIEEKGQKIRHDMVMKEAELEQTGQNIKQDLEKKVAEFEQTGQKFKQDLEKKEAEFEQTGQQIKQDLEKKEAEFEQTGQKIKQDLDTKEAEFEQTGQQIKQDLEKKEGEFEQTGQKIKLDLEKKKAEFELTGHNIKQDLEKKKAEFELTGHKIKQDLEMIKRNLVINEDESKSRIEQKGIEIEKKLTRQKVEATEEIEQKVEESRLQYESQKILVERLMTQSAETRNENVANEDVANEERKDFQKKLVKLYVRDVQKVTPFPRLHRNKRNVDDMYVPSWMTENVKNEESGKLKEIKISMDKIFRNKTRPAKSIFVIGEAGSGKSTFCKMLVHFWCIAHSHQEGSLDKSNMVTEMERFDFLFYVSLRYYSDCNCIEKMLKKSFDDPALGDILQNGSNKCLIVLDGLDEWNLDRKHISQFQTPGLPGREVDADYTIITTSRQWKFDALSLSESEVGKNIKLNGIEFFEIRNLTVKTVETLNDIHKLNKDAETCIYDLGRRQVSDISHTPLMLQQLVCLWYNDKLQGNSQCAIYGSMLDLFLEWKSLETSESQNPLYVIETSRKNTHVKYYLSYLAYEALFDKNKETTLTFSSLKLNELSIPDDVIKDCLASGVLKEERIVSLGENIQSTISFFHKSVQEYLAAVYIASQFKEMHSPKDVHALIDVGKKCVDKYFGSYKTVRDIFEHSNVLIMLCGLEPRLLTNVSEYIYNVSLVDEKVVQERNNILEDIIRHTGYSNMINRIQSFIFKCVANVLSSAQCESNHSHVYIADLNVSNSTDLLRYCHNCILKSVRSIEINRNTWVTCDTDVFHNAMEHLTKCDQLQVIRYKDYGNSVRMSYNKVTSLLATNINTLETVSLANINERTISGLVTILPNMRQLTSIHVNMDSLSRVPHDVILSLSKFLYKTTRLQYISINIFCEEFDIHKMDLSDHKQLRHASFMWSSFCLVSCNTDNLETCKLSITSVYLMNKVCNILCKAGKLKLLYLFGEIFPWNCSETQGRNIIDNLIRLLSSLHSLSTLILHHLTLSDNIISRPCDMKNLKEIELFNVIMSMTTWCKFVDCLPALPQVVEVRATCLYITDNKFPPRRIDRKKKEDALQYVREKTTLFRVLKDISYFQFTTKKM